MATAMKKDRIKSALLIGAAGGAFWSLLGYVFYFMNFSKIGPAIVVRPLFATEMADKPIAHFAGIVVFTALSIVFALLYVARFSKYYTPWIGVAGGALLFGLFYYAVNPLLRLTSQPLHQMGMNTFTTQLCLFILHGLFVGFSLSAEYSSKERKAK